MLTIEQLITLARAICAILRAPGAGPNPFAVNLFANMIPEEVIDEIEAGMGEFGFAGRPAGPFGKDIRSGFLEVAVDGRGCVYSISVTGGVKRGPGATRTRETHSTDWKPL